MSQIFLPKYAIIFLLAIVGVTVAERSDFFFTLNPSQNICFEEILVQDIGVHINVICQSRMCSLRIYDPVGKQLYYKERDPEFDFSFTTAVDGPYKVCLINYQNQYTKTEINIRSGVDAKNYDNLVTQKKLKPIELQAQKLEDFAKELKRIMKHFLRAERILQRTLRDHSSSIAPAGFVCIGIMVVSTLLSLFILRTYFNKKKKI
ncbi:unnamed protein product [Moneuplotes crassus]|uniref:GOLD domain-containing protein n=2 Tax=Euplotes crassus TaxID=5936 RepID=A0AAD1XWZ9_EUPCR|nr:unnamed protein product [Moneuplotes crassus]